MAEHSFYLKVAKNRFSRPREVHVRVRSCPGRAGGSGSRAAARAASARKTKAQWLVHRDDVHDIPATVGEKRHTQFKLG